MTVRYDSLNSKAYSAAKATSSESEVYSYSSGDYLESVISANTAEQVSADQDLNSAGGVLVYVSTVDGLGSRTNAEEGNAVSGKISASVGSHQTIEKQLTGEVQSATLSAAPTPGSWVGYGGFIKSNPSILGRYK